MMILTRNLLLILVFALSACTNGTNAPKSSKNKLTGQNLFQNGNNTDFENLFTPTKYTLKITKATFQDKTGNKPEQINLLLEYPASPPVNSRTDLPNQICGNDGCVCQFEWNDTEIGLRKSEAMANPSPSYPINVFCDLPAYFTEEVILNATARTNIKISVKSKTDHTNVVESNVFTNTIQSLPTIGSSDLEFNDISKSICYFKIRRHSGLLKSAVATIGQTSKGKDTDPNSNFSLTETGFPVLSSSQYCYSHYSNTAPLVGGETLSPSNFRSPAGSTLDYGNTYSNFDSNTSCGTKPPSDTVPIHTEGFPLSLYQNSDNSQLGADSNELFQCVIENGNRTLFHEFRLRSNPSGEYSVPVGARACIGKDCQRLDPDSHPCFANVVNPNGSLFPQNGCLGFAKPLDQTGVCTTDSANEETFRLRKYTALYPPLFDANGYPLPTDFTNSAPRPKLLYDEIYVLDRKNTNGKQQTGPLPCPLKFQTEITTSRSTSYINTWDSLITSFNKSFLPFNDIATINRESQNNPSILNYLLDSQKEASCAATLPIPFMGQDGWKLSINTVNTIDNSASPSLEKLLISGTGLLIRADQPFSPVYAEDTSFRACARPPKNQPFPAPISLKSGSNEAQYCVQYLPKTAPSDLGEKSLPLSASESDISNTISNLSDFRSRREPAGHVYRCKTTNTGGASPLEKYNLSPSSSCQ